jgi:aminoglycoside phosphotransferase (APT) family kinase protein
VRTIDPEEAFASWARETLGAGDAQLGTPLGGGNANVTRRVTIDGRPYVLRHPPTHTVSDRAAAGIRREWDLLRGIAGAAKVPAPLAFCDDMGVIGAPFLLVEFVEGVAITDRLPNSYADDAATVSQIGEELVDALAMVHRIDWQGALPPGFGRPEGFVRRQIERWTDIRHRDVVRDLPLLHKLGSWLLERVPSDEPATIIHCDFHLDNTLFAPHEPRLATIIDWEMATVGPPLVDLGLLTMFWHRDPSGTLGFPDIQAVSNRAGVVDAATLARRWQAATGLPIDNLPYHQVFAFWRLAAIVEGAFVLHVRGQVDSFYARGLAHNVPALLAEAAVIAGVTDA